MSFKGLDHISGELCAGVCGHLVFHSFINDILSFFFSKFKLLRNKLNNFYILDTSIFLMFTFIS